MQRPQAGFTLVEVMVTVAIIAVLAALTLINLGKPQTTVSINGTVATMEADIKGQQLLAMSGDGGSTSAGQPHGVVIASDHYTLFAGSTFDSGDDNNYTATPGHNITFDTTFAGSTVLFGQSSGEVQSFDGGNNTITIHGDDGDKTITINRFGTITVE